MTTEPVPILELHCGAILLSNMEAYVCPDPYCRVCRDETGEVREPWDFQELWDSWNRLLNAPAYQHIPKVNP